MPSEGTASIQTLPVLPVRAGQKVFLEFYSEIRFVNREFAHFIYEIVDQNNQQVFYSNQIDAGWGALNTGSDNTGNRFTMLVNWMDDINTDTTRVYTARIINNGPIPLTVQFWDFRATVIQ